MITRSRLAPPFTGLLLAIAGLPALGQSEPHSPPVYPPDWIDLPAAPMVLELKPVRGELALVLTNRGPRGIVAVELGCVRERGTGHEVLSEFAGVSISDGSIAPAHHVDMSHEFDRPRDQSPARPMRCPQSHAAVTRVAFEDGTAWHAGPPADMTSVSPAPFEGGKPPRQR